MKKLLFKILGGLFIGSVIVSLLGQCYVFIHPGYSNIIIEPEPVVGWTLAPDIEFINTGMHWYANELSVRHKINSLGFADLERSFEKPQGTVRVAVIGDSFVEALQVPRKKSAIGVLERMLNERDHTNSYEVQNFGLSNLSLGQYLLVWEEYASKFSPDYVFIFVTGLQMERTVQKEGDWGTKTTRPSFELVDGKLTRHPMTNYAQALLSFQEEIQQRGGRSVKRDQKLWITDWIKSDDMSRFVKSLLPQRLRLALKQLVTDNTIKPFIPALKDKLAQIVRPTKEATAAVIEPEEPILEISQEVLGVNLKVIEELNQKIEEAGSKLIVVDSSLYFWFRGANDVLTKRLEDFCETNSIGYLPLYKDLLETDKNNIWARFPHSHHLNEHGNAIFAQNMFHWMEKRG